MMIRNVTGRVQIDFPSSGSLQIVTFLGLVVQLQKTLPCFYMSTGDATFVKKISKCGCLVYSRQLYGICE